MSKTVSEELEPCPLERLAEHLSARPMPFGSDNVRVALVADWLDYSLNRCGLVVISEHRLAALSTSRDGELLRAARNVLEPFAKAAAAVELNDPDFPPKGACLRASFDFWTRSLGRDNDEVIQGDSVRLSDLRRVAELLAKIDAALSRLSSGEL